MNKIQKNYTARYHAVQTNIHPIGKVQCIFILTVQYLFSVILTMHVNNQGAVTLSTEAAEATQE
jgi:hypothetical protein